MLGLLIFLAHATMSLCCKCAPLASCVVHANGSWGCVCPYYGDGYNTCEEQRFFTDVVVRAKSDLSPWLQHLANARVGHMTQRRLLADTQYVLELDSTNYEAMLELTDQVNRKGWPFQVALLGSASSRIVSTQEVVEFPPLLEVVNITYAAGWWDIEFVSTFGLFFVAQSPVPLPCIHTRMACCSMEYAYSPFMVGLFDINDLVNCRIPNSNKTQGLGSMAQKWMKTNILARGDNSYVLKVYEDELGLLGTVDDNNTNFSIGVLNYDQMATQVYISLRRERFVTSYDVFNFTRQVAQFIMAQVEQIGTRTFVRCWAQITLPNATVISSAYAWGDMDWIEPICTASSAPCFALPPPCAGTLYQLGNGLAMMEMWVPLRTHKLDAGNLSLYFVLQQGQNLARVMTSCKPDIAVRHCTELSLSESVEIQLLQGLQLRQIFRGAAVPTIPLNVEPQTDTLITVLARSARGAQIEELRAIHARTVEERSLVETGKPCPTCVIEQLVLAGKAASPRSCFVFGAGDPAAWIQNYVGLVGSSLALDVLARVPADAKSGAAAAAWINPVWPYATDETITATTYLYAKFSQSRPPPSPVLRRLLNLPELNSPLQSSSQHKGVRAQWCMIAAASVLLLAWHILQTLQWRA